MIEQVGGLMGGLTGGGGARGGANTMAPNDTIYLCNFRQQLAESTFDLKLLKNKIAIPLLRAHFVYCVQRIRPDNG